jgi:hypothetical protein
MKEAKVSLGRVVVTPAAQLAVELAHQRLDEFLQLHQQGNWGDADQDTVRRNEEALRTGGPILSSFETCGNDQLLILTEDGTTTVLLSH